MKKRGVVLFLLLMLSGCISQGTALDVRQGVKQQGQNVLDQMIYLQAESAMIARTKESYSVLIEPVSGSVMTLLKEKDQPMNKLIIHGSGYTQWIQIFDDRILCLTGNNGEITVELKNGLLQQKDLETIMKCAQNPVNLVQKRSFQRVSGAEEGSVQIATDNIDYWMKVSENQQMDQVRLYFSDLPMMTMTYSNEIPAFPEIVKEDYPTYKEYLNITDEILKEKGFNENNERSSDSKTEQISVNEEQYSLKYTVAEKGTTIQMIFNEFVLKGFYTDEETGTYCEVVFIGDEKKEDEMNCGTKEITMMQNVFDQLMEEFK